MLRALGLLVPPVGVRVTDIKSALIPFQVLGGAVPITYLHVDRLRYRSGGIAKLDV